MSPEISREDRLQAINDALLKWRQGDCVLGDLAFVYEEDPALSMSGEGPAEETDESVVKTPVPGFVVVTQTCDIVRKCTEKPFLEVCPLLEVSEEVLKQVKLNRFVSLGYIPSLADRRLVAHLDRVMTIEKPVAAKWERVPGLSTDEEARDFARSLARKRARFAFPDDFIRASKSLLERLKEKHNKNSPEGRALQGLREIRVLATPDWDSASVDLFFWFIRGEEDLNFEGVTWADHKRKWLDFIAIDERYLSVHGEVVTLDDMTATDYLESDQLDLDYLSGR